jgi:hypothetical protein
MGGTFEFIEKLVTERAAADIIGKHLEFAKAQSAAEERKVSELQVENGRLQERVERVLIDLHGTQQELQRLKKEHEEEIRIHRCIEFRRGKRTGNRWAAFCPKCHMPAIQYASTIFVTCSDGISCKWSLRLDKLILEQIIGELGT